MSTGTLERGNERNQLIQKQVSFHLSDEKQRRKSKKDKSEKKSKSRNTDSNKETNNGSSSSVPSYTAISGLKDESSGVFSIEDMEDEGHEEEESEYSHDHALDSQKMNRTETSDDDATQDTATQDDDDDGVSFEDYLRHAWLEPFLASTKAVITMDNETPFSSYATSVAPQVVNDDDDDDDDNQWESEGEGLLDKLTTAITAVHHPLLEVEGKIAEASEAITQWSQFLLCAPPPNSPPNTHAQSAEDTADEIQSSSHNNYFLPDISPQALAEAYLAHLRQPAVTTHPFFLLFIYRGPVGFET